MLVSGTGSILEAMLDAGIDVALVAADRSCRGLEVAAAAGIPTELVARDRFDAGFDRPAYSARMAQVLLDHQVDLLVMAGFGTIFDAPMHDAFGGRMLNTHPALLPSFKGWHAVRDALAYGVKVTGCTVNVAGLDVDTGASLQERIKAVERRIYPDVVRRVVAGEIALHPTNRPTPTAN